MWGFCGDWRAGDRPGEVTDFSPVQESVPMLSGDKWNGHLKLSAGLFEWRLCVFACWPRFLLGLGQDRTLSPVSKETIVKNKAELWW